jgi:transcriptional regulator with XRE-family HTH domain
MTNTKEIRSLMAKKGLTQCDVAKALGISYQSFSYKLNNRVEFKASEIEALCVLLDIENKDEYFFCS